MNSNVFAQGPLISMAIWFFSQGVHLPLSPARMSLYQVEVHPLNHIGPALQEHSSFPHSKAFLSTGFPLLVILASHDDHLTS